MIDQSLAKMLVEIARIFCRQRDVTPKEIELWIKHAGPHMERGSVKDYDRTKQAILDFYADMHEHGLAGHPIRETEESL